MAGNPIADYQQAVKNLETATREAQRIADVVVDVGTKLRNWKRVSVANSGIGFPTGHDISVDASMWPTAQKVGEAIAQYHSAWTAAHNAWSAIPADNRAGLQPPPRDRYA